MQDLLDYDRQQPCACTVAIMGRTQANARRIRDVHTVARSKYTLQSSNMTKGNQMENIKYYRQREESKARPGRGGASPIGRCKACHRGDVANKETGKDKA